MKIKASGFSVIHCAIKRSVVYLELVILLLLVLTACSVNPPATPVSPGVGGTPMPESGSQAATPVRLAATLADAVGTPTPDTTSEAGGIGRNTAATASSEVASRTPAPTATPGFVDQKLGRIASTTGLGGFSFLGLTAADWINVVISILIFFIGYVVLTRVLSRLLLRAAQRTKTKFDDNFLQTVGPQIEKVVGIFLLGYVIQRLGFVSVSIKSTISNILFVLGLIFVVIILLKLVNFTAEWYRQLLKPDNGKDDDKGKDNERLDPAITLLQHASYILILLTGILVGLVHFGIEISIYTTMLLIIGFGVVVGARTILADLVGGFIILVGQPFRVGDAIELEGWQNWGIVETIGSRTIQVRTGDNRTVIIPNSMASSGQLVNYSHPESTVRVQTDIRIAYHTDLDQIRKLITDTLRGVGGVLPDKPIEILYREFGNSTRLLRVRWWIPAIDREYTIVDAVNSAIEDALTDAGIEIPFTTLDLSLNQVVGSPTKTKSEQDSV